MKKVSFASFLAISALTAVSAVVLAPGALSSYGTARAQAAAPAAAAGQVTLDPAEFADYDNAVNKQTTPQTQAPAMKPS